MSAKAASVLALLYGVLLVYASLMPFDFIAGELVRLKFQSFWGHWPFNPAARVSGSDVVSNLALYVPLGWAISARCRLGKTGVALSMAIGAAACSTVSVCVELVQLIIVSRTSSASDWLLNSVGGFAGATAGAVCGRELCVKAVRWLRRCWAARPLDIATLAVMVLIAADALAPYLPTIEMSSVWRSLKRSHFDIVQGLALHPWHWWIVTRVMVFAVLTMLLASWGGKKPWPKRWVQAAAVSAGFALVLELAKPMILTRAINIANVATSWLGCLLALLIGPLLSGKVSPCRKQEFAIAGVLTYIVYLAWTPFDFGWDAERFPRVVSSPIQLLPLYHYAMGATLDHARLFIQSIWLLAMLVYMVRIRAGWPEVSRRGILFAAVAAGALGFFLEAGQIFLPSRTPSMTDVYCFASGGALGAWLTRQRIWGRS